MPETPPKSKTVPPNRPKRPRTGPRRRRERGGPPAAPIGPELTTSHPVQAAPPLPAQITTWFEARGWQLRPHQAALLSLGAERRSSLLIAPTGAGKTLAGFLPPLVDLHDRKTNGTFEPVGSGLHTLYISPLKALAVDIARNLTGPVAEMGLDVTIETRSGDTSAATRQRQRKTPPDILLTTPEQIALLLSHPDCTFLFADLRYVILDELHALVASKRGDLLGLDLARLRAMAPAMTITGLSATVARPSELRAFIAAQDTPDTRTELSALVQLRGGAKPKIEILEGDDPLPWSGHTARYAMQRVYETLKRHNLSLVFVNTRSQAEQVFQELWRLNEDNLPIGLHHGSLEAEQRRKVEAAMADGRLKAVVATSTLDLGIDWGDVDLVIHIGAPKGASRLIQRIGRSNHRLDEPSQALLVPSNRFEVLECRAALDAAEAGAQDAVLNRTGALDVLAQHVMGVACAGPFDAEDLLAEVRSAQPYAGLKRETFERVVDFVATGGYALRSYERFARLRRDGDGKWRISHPRLAQQHRLNIGTIVQSPMLKVRMIKARSGGNGAREPRAQRPRPGAAPAAAGTFFGGRVMGEIDEWFAGELTVGDTFVFAGEVVRFEALRQTDVFVSRASAKDPTIPSYPGGKFPLSTHLADRVRALLADDASWHRLPAPVSEWLALQAARSVVPTAQQVLIETFPRGDRHYLVAYPFEGRLAHQTLGMLLTRRLERAGLLPLGFVANDYGLSVWCGADLNAALREGRLDLAALFDEDMLGDDLDAWLAGSTLMKRTFRYCAAIAGLIERRHPGKEKTGRQMTVSSDLIYDVLRRHDPNHILLEATWADAATGLLDVARLAAFLARINGNIQHAPLTRISPLSVPILLEIGKEPVYAASADALLQTAAFDLVQEALSTDPDEALETPHPQKCV